MLTKRELAICDGPTNPPDYYEEPMTDCDCGHDARAHLDSDGETQWTGECQTLGCKCGGFTVSP